MSVDELPVVPGEVIGWRAWVVLSSGYREPRLRSLYFDVVWPTNDWLIATDGDQPYDPRNVHGICAARDREHLVSMHRYGSVSWPRYVSGVERVGDAVIAVGEVALAGVIYPGERGYRAGKARVASVLVPYVAWDLVEGLARAYRVPVGLANVLISEGGVVCGHRS